MPETLPDPNVSLMAPESARSATEHYLRGPTRPSHVDRSRPENHGNCSPDVRPSLDSPNSTKAATPQSGSNFYERSRFTPASEVGTEH
jgi:hypothetical protein